MRFWDVPSMAEDTDTGFCFQNLGRLARRFAQGCPLVADQRRCRKRSNSWCFCLLAFFLTSSIHLLKRCSAYINSNFRMIVIVFLLLFIWCSKQLEIKCQLLNILCSDEETKYQDNRLTGTLPSSGRFSFKKTLLVSAL